MTTPNLQFTHEPSTAPQPAFDLDERRRQNRKSATDCVTIVRRNFNATAFHHPLCSMRLRDLSNTGASAFSQIPLQIGEAISIFFDSPQFPNGFESHGSVRRCTPANTNDPETQYTIAIEFDRAMSA